MTSDAWPFLTLRSLLERGAEACVRERGGKGVAVLLRGGGEKIEILYRRGLSLELCRAVTALFGAGRGGRPEAGYCSREQAMGRWPPLAVAMGAEGLRGLWTETLPGWDGSLGWLVAAFGEEGEGAKATPGGNRGPVLGPLLESYLSRVAAHVLDEILALRVTGAGWGAQALLVVDGEERIVLQQGVFSLFPEWGWGPLEGRCLRSLPGGRVLAGLGSALPGTFWRERSLGAELEGRRLEVGVLPLPSGRGGPAAGQALLLRKAEGEARREAGGDGAFLLELALRVSKSWEAGGEGRGSRWDLVQRTMALVDREDQEEAVDLSEVLRSLLGQMEAELRKDRIQVLPFLGRGLPAIRTDRRLLESALGWLLRYVWRELGGAGGTLSVRTWEEGQGLWCAFSHDGRGEGEGGETALAVAQELLRAGGGTLHLERRPGLWTRIQVAFPSQRLLSSHPDVRLPTPSPSVRVSRDSAGQLKVLVVDDNPMVRTVLRRFLEKKGCSVVEAEDGASALDLVAEGDFDRIMVDIDMPGTTGLEFYQRLEDVAPRLRERTIFMTGGYQEDTAEAFVLRTGRPRLHKPFELREIAEVLGTP